MSNKETTNVLEKPWATSKLVCMPDCWLEVSMYPKGHMTGHLCKGFLG